jgi:S-adenosylmethionine decarboxylase proenzyme
MSQQTPDQEKDSGGEPQPYIVRVSRTFIYVSLITSILLAFTIGRAARIILIEGPRRALLAPPDTSAMFVRPEHSRPSLPNPQLIGGKEVPRTLYTAKNFDTAMGASTASVYLERSLENTSHSSKDSNGQSDENSYCKADQNDQKQCSRSSKSNAFDINPLDSDAAAQSSKEALHVPAGQHLLVDIKNVDGTFLNSELRLSQAMINVVNESKLTLLSYHCHKLIPMGVSCVGVLLESHISFHTWPEEGVITLDLFTCGSGELVPVLPIIEKLFAIPIEDGDTADPPQIVWSHKLRGFNPEPSVLGDDLGQFVLERTQMDLKVEVSWFGTGFYCFVLKGR